jgi:peptidylprolyl isomerase
MKLIIRLAAALALVIAAAVALPAVAAPAGTPHLLLQVTNGTIDIELEPNLAPLTVKQIVTLTDQGFYNGLKFHRVIDGFMAQTGDPKGDGSGGSSLPNIKGEFTDTPFVRGTVGMARAEDPDSANSQFFIMFGDGSFLNGKYTVFGKVVAGMEAVDKIKRGNPADNGTVNDPDKIISAKIEYK